MHPRWLTVLTLAATLAAGACSPADAPTLPRADGISHASAYRRALLEGTPKGSLSRSTEELIGSAGGTVSAAGHTLVVPAGAVSVPTKFVIEPTDGGHVSVELHAYRADANGHYTVDVGAAGFAEPVKLTLSYAWADGVFTPAGLSIVYLADGTENGRLSPLTSTVNTTAQTVSASLAHFSGYAIATGG